MGATTGRSLYWGSPVTADQIADADAFAEGLTPTDRRNQVALPSVLDAALRDPRWRAACAVGRLH